MYKQDYYGVLEKKEKTQQKYVVLCYEFCFWEWEKDVRL